MRGEESHRGPGQTGGELQPGPSGKHCTVHHHHQHQNSVHPQCHDYDQRNDYDPCHNV